MSTEKRLVLFFVLSLALMWGTQTLLEALGLVPKRALRDEAAPEAVAEDEASAGPPRAFANDPDGPLAFAANPAPAGPALAETPEKPAIAKPVVPEVPVDQLTLGSPVPPRDPDTDYLLEVQLTQRGAGIRHLVLAQHQAELAGNHDRGRRLTLLDPDPFDFPVAFGPPLALQIVVPRTDNLPAAVYSLGEDRWEAVPDDQGRIRRPLAAQPESGRLEGESVVFRATVPTLGLNVEKTISLRKGVEGLELDLRFTSDRPQTIAYRLLGPYGVPIEGEWYTSTFRDVFFGKINASSTELETKAANEVVEKEERGDPVRTTTLPLKYAGVENQYFAVFLEPDPLPAMPQKRVDEKTVAVTIKPAREKAKSEVSVVVESKPIPLTPGQPVDQAYRVFAGAKTTDALEPFQAIDLTSFRRGWQFPLIGPAATWLARNLIAPLLDQIYGLTRAVAGLFGGHRGNYGIAIILLTIVVRLCMFPLSRKQALSAKRMQDLQPQLLALREKYKDDKEAIGRETLQLYRKNGVNPFGGCLLVFIQMPVFLGLWQALNNSVSLRNAPFLWIQNLAAPDMLFKLPFEVPLLGAQIGPYFNLLPILVVALMLVQTKLFAPPATSPEMKQQQQIMNVMMVVMAFVFYRVPSGLGLYFITSSLWSITERLILPAHRPAARGVNRVEPPAPPGEVPAKPAPRPKAPAGGNGNQGGGFLDRLRERAERVMEEAAHDKTVRNADRDRQPERKRPSRGNPPRKRRP
jgi:YidC/Oxa1 family membrane protein insertase